VKNKHLLKKILGLFLAWAMFFSGKAQSQSFDLDQFVQSQIGIPTDAQNYEVILEAYSQLYQHPLDLNRITNAQLVSFQILSQKQIDAFFTHKQKAGAFISVFELQAIEGWDLDLVQKIAPFVQVVRQGLSAQNLGYSLNQADQTLWLRTAFTLEQQKGFSPLQGKETVRYVGSPGNILLRYKLFHRQDVSAGLTLEKDNGEQLGWIRSKKQFATDFSSFHVQFRNKGRWQDLTLGDFTVQWGQGLLLASGFSLGKGTETILGVKRNHTGILPYTSTIEQNYFRGLAATYKLRPNLTLSMLASSNPRTANTNTDPTNFQTYATSINADGYHRTPSELADKNSLQEQNIATNLFWQGPNKNLELSAQALYTNYNLNLNPSTTYYNAGEFRGNQNYVYSLAHSYNRSFFTLFGEWAQSKSKGLGLVQGLQASLGRRSDISVVGRKYAANFNSFYAQGFGENSRTINEKGIYIGYKYAYNKYWRFTASADRFWFPSPKFGIKQASQGFEFLKMLSYKPTKTSEYTLQYRYQRKQNNNPQEDLVFEPKNLLALSAHWPINTQLQSHSQLIGNTYFANGITKQYGWALIQNMKYVQENWQFTGRLAYFNAPNYQNRIYSYEQDVQNAFSFPSYYGHGIRFFVLAQYKVSKGLLLQTRLSRTQLFQAETIGSDLEQISKPHRTDLKIQAVYKF
jgi:hypothetical protein